jgi:hypothetical protein
MTDTEMTDTEFMTKVLIEMKTVEEKYAAIQKNPAMNGAENGLTAGEQETLAKLLAQIGEANIAGDAILERLRGGSRQAQE